MIEIVVQTSKRIWSINRKGIRRVSTIDWDNMKATVNALMDFQAQEAQEANNAPVFQRLNDEVDKGRVSAQANAKAWRNRHSTKHADGWHGQRSQQDTVTKILENQPLK